ncbi:MAG: hypothetical protein DMG11_15255, partial [Acidobacteria bacterium]
RAPHLLKSVGTDITNVSSGSLAKAIAQGDDEIDKLVRNRCHTLGIALSNLVDFLNPEMIVLGGGLTEAMPDLVRDEVEAGVRANSKPESKKSLEVVVAALKDHSVTTGGPGWFKHKDTKGTKTRRRPPSRIVLCGLLCVFVPFVSLCLNHPGPRSIHDFGGRLQRGRRLDAGRDFGQDSKLDINRPNDTANFRHTSG